MTWLPNLYKTNHNSDCGEIYAWQHPWMLLPKELERLKMGRPKKQDATAAALLEALAFVSVAGTKDIAPYNTHACFTEGWVIMCDGQVTAGHPIQEDLRCCPQFAKLKVALNKCGKTLAVTHLDTGRLSIKGDLNRFIVPCLPPDQMPDLEWDDMIAPCDDTLKEAFKVCGVLTDENATDVIEASICMEAWVCSATDRKSMVQKRHNNSLPRAILPKIFTNAVAKMKQPIVGFGWTEGRSITLHFEGGAWIKTLLYIDEGWNNIAAGMDRILSVQTSPIKIPSSLVEAVATIADFKKDDEIIMLGDEVVQSHISSEVGAQYAVEGLQGKDKQLHADYFKILGPYITEIDTTSYPDRIFFFGEGMRGVVTCFISNGE